MVESLASGIPVIAYERGGASEIVTKDTGILYDELSFQKAQDLTEPWTQEDRNYINKVAPIDGLKAKFKNGTILDMAQNFLEIAKQGLDRRNILNNNKTYNETYYLKN